MDLSPHVLDQFAVQAASGYSVSGNLDHEIAKIAEEAELTEQQIAALVPEANHELNRRLHGTLADKQFAFKTASVAGVKAVLSKKHGPKLASFYETGFSSLGVDELSEKTAGATEVEVQPYDWIRDPQARVNTVKNLLKQSAAYLERYAEEIRQAATEAKFKIASSYAGLKKEIQQAMRSDNIKFASICEAAVGFKPALKTAIIEILQQVKTDCLKTASPVETDLLKFDPKALDGKDEIGTRIINGNHHIMVHLDDLMNNAYQLGAYTASVEGMRDRASALTSAIHTLVTPEDVDAYVANEVQQLANAVKVGSTEALAACIKFGRKLEKTASVGQVAKALAKSIGPATKTFGRGAWDIASSPMVAGPGLHAAENIAPTQILGGLHFAGESLKDVGNMVGDVRKGILSGGSRSLGISHAQ